MPDYTQGKIYKIYSYESDDIYIGSTTQKLSMRMSKHRSNYKKYVSGILKKYYSSFEILKFQSAKIELIEKYSCNCKEELEKKEGYYIKNLDCVNKRVEDRSPAEYYQDNKQKIKLKAKEYYQDNKQKIKLKAKEYYENNKEKIYLQKKEYLQENKQKIKEYQQEYRQDNKQKAKEYYQDNKQKAKEYYQDNKQKIKEYQQEYRQDNKKYFKQYYQNNKQKIALREKQKITCQCGATVLKKAIKRHERSKKHQEYLTKL